ncbi:MAG: M48 family metallopeptidase [Chloroflexi bacterium]|nr:M48 family metallopeptidase [Chloroflexota bacterium]
MTPIGTSEACLDGRVVTYCIKRSPRACRVRLEVRSDTGLTVVIPRAYQIRDLPDVLQQKKRWILGKLAESARARTAASGGLRHGDAVPYLGRELQVVQLPRSEGLRHEDPAWLGVRLEGDRLAVSCPDLSGPGDAALGSMVERWYRAQALNIVSRKVEEASRVVGVDICRITVREQRTRWGSCSRKGNLSFNWKLLMAPEPVMDYVVIHELCHLKEMNHSKRFWQVVARYCPRWREHKKWLRDHGVELAAAGETLNPKLQTSNQPQ